MIYALIFGSLLLLVVLFIVVRDVLRRRRERLTLHEKIHDRHRRSYAFLIDREFEVIDTNYYDLNPDVEKAPPYVLGNVLHCQTGTDCGKCGTGFACKTCPVRYVINNAFRQKRNFEHVEAKMNLYDAVYKVHTVDVELDGEFVFFKNEPHMLVTAKTLRSDQRI